jgi:AcrR family transcriptional regulator
MKKDDPRVIRTRQIIKDAFRALLKTKGFDAITIKDIAERATINRATFYAHYEDKYALLDEIIVQTFENMLPEQIIVNGKYFPAKRGIYFPTLSGK